MSSSVWHKTYLLKSDQLKLLLAACTFATTTSFSGCGSVAESGLPTVQATSVQLDSQTVSTSNQTPKDENQAASSTIAESAPAPAKENASGKSTNPIEAVDQAKSELSGSAEPVKFLGEWTDHFHGRRVMKFAEDGTGVMILELDTVGALLYGSKLEFDFQWSVAGNILEMKMKGGRPKATTESLSKSWGAEHQYEILDVTPELFSIRNLKGQTVCHLKPFVKVAQTVKP